MTLEKLTKLYENKEPSPLLSAQTASWERFLELGLPINESDAFRYLRGQDILQTEFLEAPTSCPPPIFEETFLLFHNGKYLDEKSKKDLLPKEMIVMPLTKAWKTFGNFIQGRFLEMVKKEKDPYAALNGALCEEGAFIYLPPHTSVKEPLTIFHHGEIYSSFLLPRLHICLGKGASLTLHIKESGSGFHFQNSLIDIVLEEGATLKIVHLANQGSEAESRLALRATLKRSSTLHSLVVTNGGKRFRQDAVVALAGEGASAELKGLSIVENGCEAHFHLEMQHLAPHTQSLQLYKNVLKGASKTSFEGKIWVEDVAQKTQAYQRNPNLLLSERATAVSKPNLEIFADDVKASHGTTVGQLDCEHIFYLKSRGLSLLEAQKLLVFGFCKEILDEIEDDALKRQAVSFVSL